MGTSLPILLWYFIDAQFPLVGKLGNTPRVVLKRRHGLSLCTLFNFNTMKPGRPEKIFALNSKFLLKSVVGHLKRVKFIKFGTFQKVSPCCQDLGQTESITLSFKKPVWCINFSLHMCCFCESHLNLFLTHSITSHSMLQLKSPLDAPHSQRNMFVQ